jgi:hypothetical protein
MTRVRSPGYPSISLDQAIEIVGKIYTADRTNGIDRDAAVRDMGYSGITGASGKMLANLLHYGLIEKAGKGGVKVSSLAVDILHPENEATKKAALYRSAFEPSLFSELRSKFKDGTASENAIRSYLMREGFSDVAVGPAISSFLETSRYLEKEGASESQEAGDPIDIELAPTAKLHEGDRPMSPDRPKTADTRRSPNQPAPGNTEPHAKTGSRIVFSEEGDRGASFQLHAEGEVTDSMLEALEDYVKRQRKRLARPQ